MTIATGAIVSPYVKEGVIYLSKASHEMLSSNVPGYENASRQVEWICGNHNCKMALVDQTPLASVVSVLVGNVVGANCKECGNSLQYSHNVSPVVKYKCLAGLCELDAAGEFAEKIMNEYDRRVQRDGAKKFSSDEFDSILESRNSIERYLKKNIAL